MFWYFFVWRGAICFYDKSINLLIIEALVCAKGTAIPSSEWLYFLQEVKITKHSGIYHLWGIFMEIYLVVVEIFQYGSKW